MKIKYIHIFIIMTIINIIGGVALLAVTIQNSRTTGNEEKNNLYANFTDVGLVAVGAAMAVAGSCIGAGIALSAVASAGFAASVERPELKSYMLMLGGLAEGIAIYGLLIAILIIGKI